MATVLDLECCRVDLERATVTWPDRTVSLTEVEVRLLTYLAQHVGQAISRAELLQEVWGYSPKVRSRAVDQTMKRLRPKVEPDPKSPVTLQSAVGVGYRLVLPVRDAAEAVAVTPGRVPRLRGQTHGRDAALIALAERLSPGRAVAITGPPGVGKSHVAHALALQWRDAHDPPGGVWVVDCSAVRDDATLVEALCHTAAVTTTEGMGIAELAARLKARGDALFVLDNLDRHPGASPSAAALAEGSGARWVLTLRRRAGPEVEQSALAALDSDAAVALLTDRVRLLAGDIPLPPADTAALVAALGHNPLAVCLAATHCTLLSPKELRQRFGQDPRLLASTTADSAERFVSVERALAVSWSLLEPEAQAALSALSALSADVPLDTALHVAGAKSVAVLQSLAAHSLVEPRYEDGGVTYRVPLLIRSYAAHQDPRAARAATGRLHGWLERLFDRFWMQPTAFAWDAALPLLRHEEDLREAAEAATTADAATRLGLALAETRRLRGDAYGQSRALRRLARRFPEADDPDLRLFAGVVRARMPLLHRTREARAEALEALRPLRDACTHPAAVVHLLVEQLKQGYGDGARARALGEELRDFTEDSAEPLWIAVGKLHHGRCLGLTGDLPQALEEFEHAEVLAEGRDAPGLQAYALYSCGYACMEMGALSDAGARFASARRILGDAGDPRAPMLDALSGLVALLEDRYDAAEEHFRTSARYADAQVLGWAREDEVFMGYLALARGDLGGARRWLASAVDRGRRWGAGAGVGGALLAATRVALGEDPAVVASLVARPSPWSDIEQGAVAYVQHIADGTALDPDTLPRRSAVERGVLDRALATFEAHRPTG